MNESMSIKQTMKIEGLLTKTNLSLKMVCFAWDDNICLLETLFILSTSFFFNEIVKKKKKK
jgi:hypothetical protein